MNEKDLSFDVNGKTLEMVFVEGGSFKMGIVPPKEGENGIIDNPAHEVILDDFYISRYPITWGLWEALFGDKYADKIPNNSNAYLLPKDRYENHVWFSRRCPMHRAYSEDCNDFINQLSQLLGKKFCLPTEAQWEYAARGGKYSKGYLYSGSNELKEVGLYNENSAYYCAFVEPAVSMDDYYKELSIHPIGEKKPNELDIYDMSGNVYELCRDWYDPDYYNHSPLKNPTGPDKPISDSIGKALHVYRGGNFESLMEDCLVTKRYNHPDFEAGFRIVLMTNGD